MSRIAKGRYERPAVLRTSARADSQQRRSPIHSELPAVLARGRAAGGVGAGSRRFLLLERVVAMRNRVDIDHAHSRAIVQEIGERLRAFLKEEPELSGSLRTQID